MQLFSADAGVRISFCPRKHEKTALKVAHNRPPGPPLHLFFQYCQPAQNQPKSHFRFCKNVSLRDFYIMTLISCAKVGIVSLHLWHSRVVVVWSHDILVPAD